MRYDNPDDGINAWPHRKLMVLTHLKTLQPDVVGMQEVLAHQLDWLDKNLQDYSYFGVGRDDGKRAGEFVPLLYNHTKVQQLDGGNFWLSETPNKAGSIGWLAHLPRVVSWGHFKKADKEFFVFDAHFSHVSDLARKKSAEFLMRYIPTISKDKPVVLLGDFNTLDSEPAYKTLLTPAEITFTDVAKAPNATALSTFNGFGHYDSNRIDYILISGGLSGHHYQTHKIHADGVYISDHFPISVSLTFE
nr:endonuclease/exonuclease/phosphatase family protein [Neptunicella marina]